MRRTERLNYRAIHNATLPHLQDLLRFWLPDGRLHGAEWVARNPTRSDRRPGSFKINVHNGRWADFATGDKGGDSISLFAYIRGVTQYEAATRLKENSRGAS